ncbi:MAG TPA: carbon-nitrogen hydrolase family protein [Thermoplasmata archaeon]|jgi:predicted amidohydrolase|nr:carbon-nitrogen hydrolase family protein [Thermoplasmata archaeon]
MKVALAQLDARIGDKAGNLKKLGSAVASAKADLLLAGELFLTGYMARDAFSQLAEPIDGPSVRAVRALAAEHGTHIVFGMPEREESTKRLFNTSVLVAPDGKVVSYRKAYPANFGPFEEGLYFGRGDSLTIAETALGRIGLMICYDTFFPEIAKAYALAGADFLAIISASPATSKPFFDRILPARAIENALPVLYANLVGTELNVVFQGGTQAIGPRGEDLGKAADFVESVVHADVDLRDGKTARAFRPTLRDTRKELWEPVAPEVPVRRA